MLDYDGVANRWCGEWPRDGGGVVVVIVPGAAFTRHFEAKLKAAQLPLIATHDLEQLRKRAAIAKALQADLAYWESCEDSEVRLWRSP